MTSNDRDQIQYTNQLQFLVCGHLCGLVLETNEGSMMVNRLRFVVFASLCTSLSSFVPQPLEPSLMRLHMVSTSVPSPASSSASSSSSPSSSSLPLSDQHLPKPKEIMELLSSRYTEATYDSWAKTRNYVYRTNKNRLSHFQIQEVLRFLDNSKLLVDPTQGLDGCI